MPAFSLLAFDLDGTLVNTERQSVLSVISLLKQHYGLTISLEHWLSHYLGRGGQALLDAIFSDFGVEIEWEPFRDLRRSYLDREFSSGVDVAPGLLTVMRELYREKRPLALCSNAMIDRIKLILSRTIEPESVDLPRLEVVFGSQLYAGVDNPLLNPKPAPDVYLAAALANHVSPSACLAVEDSPTGVKAAVAAGFTCIGYVGLSEHKELEAAKLESLGATYVMHAWDEFLPLLKRLENS